MSWFSILGLAIGAYAAKAVGVLMGASRMGERLTPLTGLFPAALFAGLVVILTFDINGTLALDPRLGGVAVAALLAWKRAPFIVTVLAAMTVTALLRL